MKNSSPTQKTRDRLLYLLKTRGPLATPVLARRLTLTGMAIRLHLQALQEEGLVTSTSEAHGVGRPRKVWSLTGAGHQRFPEGYGDLAVDLLQEAKRRFGAPGLEALLQARQKKQTAHYAQFMPAPQAPLEKRVRTLARLRSEDGYMAEVTRHRDGTYSLIENHCPICAAATLCVGLCDTEMQLFQELLGNQVTITRREHLLQGSRRCTYRIRATTTP